ncbi:MAG: M48 family metalloprotease [Candidatus Heimdallarchaeaceae archaeon]
MIKWLVSLIALVALSNVVTGWEYWRWLSLRKPSEKTQLKGLFLIIAIASVVIVFLYTSPFYLLFMSNLAPLISYFLVLLFVALLFVALFRGSIQCKKVIEHRKLKEIDYYVCDNKVSNAWYVPKENKIFVSKDLVHILNEDELYAVLLHEQGHSKNKRLSILNGLLTFAWIIIVLLIVETMLALSISQTNVSTETKLALIAWLYGMGIVITQPLLAISWIEEHEADLNALQRCPSLAETLVTGLIKLEVSSRLSPHLNVNFSIDIREIDIQEVRMRSVLKEFFCSVVFSVPRTVMDFIKKPIYVTHPPVWLRAYCLKRHIL